MRNKIIAVAAFVLFFHLCIFDNFFNSLFPGTLGFAVLITAANLFLFISFIKKNFLVINQEGILFSIFSLIMAWLTIFRGDRGFTGSLLWLGSFGYLLLAFNNFISLKPFLRSAEELIFLPFTMFLSLIKVDLSGSLNSFTPKMKISNKSYSIFRGILLTLPVLAVLILLLNRADPIFNKIFTGAFAFLNNFPLLIQRIIVTIFWIIVLIPATLMLIKQSFRIDKIGEIAGKFKTEALVVVGSIIGLLGWFLVVQFKYLFAHVPENQLIRFGVNTYSEYVNKGFFELIFASLIVYGIVSVSLFIFKQQKNDSGILLRNFNFVLIGELVFLLISVFRRLILYQYYHGLTVARVYGIIFLIWLGIMIFALIGRHLWEKRWVWFEIIGTAGILMSLGLFNVDNLVATKYPPTVNGERDELYLSELSSDGYAGWKMAYDWADTTLSELEKKTEFTGEDYRKLIYTMRITSNLISNYRGLVNKYGAMEGKHFEASKFDVNQPPDKFIWQNYNYVDYQIINKMAQEIPISRLDEMNVLHSTISNKIPQTVKDTAFIDRGSGRFFLY